MEHAHRIACSRVCTRLAIHHGWQRELARCGSWLAGMVGIETVLAKPKCKTRGSRPSWPRRIRHRDKHITETGFGSITRQLPGLIDKALRLGWEANRRDTVATIGVNLVSGILTGFALLATTGVLDALFTAGPTPQRHRAALPA